MSEDNKVYDQKNINRPVTLAELEGFSKGILIDLPSPNGTSFIKVKVKRIDLTQEFLNKSQVTNFLANPVIEKYMNNNSNFGKSQDVIKNELKNEFENIKDDGLTQESIKDIKELLPLLDEICEKVLVEPTYQDFKNTCGLTQFQKEYLFNWAMGETTDLVNFRNGG